MEGPAEEEEAEITRFVMRPSESCLMSTTDSESAASKPGLSPSCSFYMSDGTSYPYGIFSTSIASALWRRRKSRPCGRGDERTMAAFADGDAVSTTRAVSDTPPSQHGATRGAKGSTAPAGGGGWEFRCLWQRAALMAEATM